MRLAYLLLFLLHLSASTCAATSRTPRFFLHPGGVPAPSPEIHDHRRTDKDLFYDARYPYKMMVPRGATPPPPASVEDPRRPPDKEIVSTAMSSPSPTSSSPHRVDDDREYHGKPGGGGDGDVNGGGGGEGRSLSSLEATEQEGSTVGDAIIADYPGPETHPPSHN